MTTVLITGANRGLGLEFARQYAESGAHVIAAARNATAATALQDIARASDGRVQTFSCDVSDGASVDSFARAVGHQGIDVVIANAGVYGGDRQSHTDMDFGAWADTFAVNTMAALRIAQQFQPHLRSGREKKFVAITSKMGSIADASSGYYAYRSSKAALNMVIKLLANDWRADGIICVPMHPGWVQTDMGGKNAPLSPAEAVSSMRKVIADLAPTDSGCFFN